LKHFGAFLERFGPPICGIVFLFGFCGSLFLSKKLIPKLGKSFEIASCWVKWLHLRIFHYYALSLDQAFKLSIISPDHEQEISTKHFLAVNLRRAFDMVAAISAQGSHFETFAQLAQFSYCVESSFSFIIHTH
jgi:hypothetical protein